MEFILTDTTNLDGFILALTNNGYTVHIRCGKCDKDFIDRRGFGFAAQRISENAAFVVVEIPKKEDEKRGDYL